jgi:hypothetical protein
MYFTSESEILLGLIMLAEHPEIKAAVGLGN